jgi:hypothetical protein
MLRLFARGGAPADAPPPGVGISSGAAALRAGALLLLGTLAATPGCGHDGPSMACVPGQSIACAGAHACSGHQVCKSDGSRYGECLCGDGGLRSFPAVGPYSGLLGAACTTPDDCRHGLECITPGADLVGGEGPSSGMCLARCLRDHNFCPEVDATAKCIVLDDGGTTDDTSDDTSFCFPGCKVGQQPAESDKCRGRVDQVCTEYPAGAGAGYCRPSCRSDVDCAPRQCDLGTGLCADKAPTGDPIGSSCDVNGAGCAGGCIAQGGSFAECSGVCSYLTQGCGQNSDPPIDYFCGIGSITTAGPGDLGYCAKVCNCDADCKRADAVCEPHPEFASKTGRQGMCASKKTPAGGVRTGLPTCL